MPDMNEMLAVLENTQATMVQLHEQLSKIIDAGRVQHCDCPDDYEELVNTLRMCDALNDRIKNFLQEK